MTRFLCRPTPQRVWAPLYPPNVTQKLAIIVAFLVGADNYEARGKTFSDIWCSASHQFLITFVFRSLVVCNHIVFARLRA